jgi:hypothetical protein
VKRLPLIAVLVGAALAVAPVAYAGPSTGAVADANLVVDHGGSAAAGMSAAEHRALTIRSEALNQRWGNVVTELSPAQFKSLYLSGGYRMTPQELAALVARSEGLNQQYRNPVVPAVHTTVQPSSTSSGPDWRYVGIAILGAMLLAALASATVTRRRHQVGF